MITRGNTVDRIFDHISLLLAFRANSIAKIAIAIKQPKNTPMLML